MFLIFIYFVNVFLFLKKFIEYSVKKFCKNKSWIYGAGADGAELCDTETMQAMHATQAK